MLFWDRIVAALASQLINSRQARRKLHGIEHPFNVRARNSCGVYIQLHERMHRHTKEREGEREHTYKNIHMRQRR